MNEPIVNWGLLGDRDGLRASYGVLGRTFCGQFPMPITRSSKGSSKDFEDFESLIFREY